jgi:hypothetical protein
MNFVLGPISMNVVQCRRVQRTDVLVQYRNIDQEQQKSLYLEYHNKAYSKILKAISATRPQNVHI